MSGAFGLPGWAWATAFCAVSALYATLLARLRARDAGHPPWWLGYALDGTNLLGAGLYVAALALCGFRGPPALVIAVALLLTSYGLDWLLGKRLALRSARLANVGFSTVLALLATLCGERLSHAVAALVAVAQPR